MADAPSSPLEEQLTGFDLATGQDACERLLSIDGMPPEIDSQTRQRMVELAPALDAVAPSARSWPIRIPAPDGWTMHGASIARAGDGFRMTVQSSCRPPNPDQSPTVHDAGGVARTRMYWVALGDELQIHDVLAIREHEAASGPEGMPATGLVDTRPISLHGDWWIWGASGDARAGQHQRPYLARLEGTSIAEVIRLGSGVRGDAVWSPVAAAGGDLRFVVRLFPTVVARCNPSNGKTTLQTRHAAPLIARRLHAATQTVPCGDGYLCLAFETVVADDGAPRTVHRWVRFDADWRVTLLSRPFRFRRRGDEMAAGLARHGDALVVSFDTGAGDLWLAAIDELEVMALLTPPLALDLAAVERHIGDERAPATRRTKRRGAARPSPTARPTIAAMTITGSSRDIVGDALRSVADWVDWCVLIDTGIEDDTLEVARLIAGERLVVRAFPWCDDFSAARNTALAAAAETGAEWAVFVDSDERLLLNGVDIHAVLAASPEPALLVPFVTGQYTKDRFFRLPAGGAFMGPTHEAFYLEGRDYGATVSIHGVVFDELPKSAERFRLKDERDREILRRYTAANPDQPRWLYYFGDVLQRLGQFAEAEAAFRACSELKGWDEESAWAMYRAAECLMELGRLEDAREAAVTGMMRHPGLGDLPWMAAHISLRLDEPRYAVYWARQSIALGHFAGIGQSVHRAGWRNPFALWEGPYDVLRVALRNLGDEAGAREAERLFSEAAAARREQPAQV